ncbi:MAG: rRNA cytosine-C5-methyltransferase [Bacteroidales bacterium]|nr:rRNA cytosine-C5-methyltransferase [Bacteroidales bacterium]
MELSADFAEKTKALFGEERYSQFSSALEAEPVVSVRHNPAKRASELFGEPVAWAEDACYLDSRPLFTADPLFHAGCYYVQEASSMFLEQVFRQYVDAPVRMLDLCAAPGGKSTHALSLLPEGSLFVANEPMPLRAGVLAENIIKWGAPNAVVTRNEPADFAPFKEFFDIIVVDAPCSGEGMFRKDARAVSMWSPSNVKTCVARQRAILSDIWDSLRPGGLLVYSTCTFNPHEDEEMVAWVRDELGAEVLPVAVSDEWGITGNLVTDDFPVYRFIPGFTRGEGFFLALLRKDGDGEVTQPRPVRSRAAALPKACNIACSWVKNSHEYNFVVENDTVVAYPRQHQAVIAALQSRLKVLHSGVAVAAVKNNKLLPLHRLAMSVALDREAFPSVELTCEQALAYLHREALALPSAPMGVILFTYKNVPLGFAKNVGNRVNNLYPAEWRIRKDPMEL